MFFALPCSRVKVGGVLALSARAVLRARGAHGASLFMVKVGDGNGVGRLS